MKNVLHNLYLALILLLFVYQTNAQSTYSKVFNGNGIDVKAYSIEKTIDSNYMIAGQKANKALIIKIDTAANIIWCKNYDSGIGFNSYFNKIIATKDSCFVLIGKSTNAGNSTENTLLVKINSNGDTLWSKLIDLNDAETIISIEQTLDGGFILAGNIRQFIANQMYKIAVVKLDKSGNLSWAKRIECGNNNEYAYAVKQLPDSNYVVIGYTENYPPFDGGAYLLKISTLGNVLWAKKHIGTSSSYSSGFNIKVCNDGLLCYLYLSNTPMLMKTDFSGNILWSKLYPSIFLGGFNNGFVSRFCQTSDNNYAFLSQNPQNFNSVLKKVDTLGNLLMTKLLYLPATDIIETYDKKLLIIGNGPIYGVKKSSISDPEIEIIKTDSNDNSGYTWCVSSMTDNFNNTTISLTSITYTISNIGVINSFSPIITNTSFFTYNRCVNVLGINEYKLTDENSLTVFPNPSNGSFKIENEKTLYNVEIDVYNTIGERIYHLSKAFFQQSSIDLGNQPDGIYYLKLSSENKVFSQRIIITH